MIDHKHKFIFIHIPKNAGSSIEQAFGYNAFDHTTNGCTYELCMGYEQQEPHRHLQHLKIDEIYDIHPGVKDSYFSFTFVRNPYSRAVSLYNYNKPFQKNSDQFSFRDYITSDDPKLNCDPAHGRHQHEYVFDCEGKSMIDFVGRVENIQEDFNTICDRIGIARIELPIVNKKTFKHYTEYYDDETRSIVAELYKQDFEKFNYQI